MTTKSDCEHKNMDWCGHGVGMIECYDCGRHADGMDMGRGELEIDDNGRWVVNDDKVLAPMDEPKCSMMRLQGGLT